MYDLEAIIQTRLAIQLGLQGQSVQGMSQVLKRAIWTYDDYGITSRLGSYTRSPSKRLLQDRAIKAPVGRAYRVMDREVFARLYPFHQRPASDKELINVIDNHGGKIDRFKLADTLSMTVRKLNYRLRKEQNRWNILKIEDTIWLSTSFISEFDLVTKDVGRMILDLLRSYPYLTVNQLEHLLQMESQDLAAPLAQLAMNDHISRGMSRHEAPDELFCLPEQKLYDGGKELGPMVLERRDALVEIIKLERYFDHGNGDYWLFEDGIPQAEFDLDRIKGKRYQTTNLRRFTTTTKTLSEILGSLERWGKNNYMTLLTDEIDDPISKKSIQMTSFLLDRGYKLEDGSLILNREAATVPTTTNEDSVEAEIHGYREVSWRTVGRNIQHLQYLQGEGTAAEIVKNLGQVDDVEGLAYRLGIPPERIQENDIIYTSGVGNRLGFVHREDISDVLRGWPLSLKYHSTDQKILDLLVDPLTTEMIQESVGSTIKVKQRLRYLEKRHRVRRLVSGDLHIDRCTWVRFEYGGLKIDKPKGGKRELAAVGTFLIKLLKTNPPLTDSQISKYLGLTLKELEPLLTKYTRDGKILSGYYFEDITEEQYTIPDIFDLDPVDEMDEATVKHVDILPLTDTYARLHLPPLVIKHSDLQPTERLAFDAQQWMIAWNGQPVGYFIKEPAGWGMIDYQLDLRVAEEIVTTPIIAGALQKIATLMRTWYQDEGKIVKINDTPPSDRKWEHLRFLIDSIGIVID